MVLRMYMHIGSIHINIVVVFNSFLAACSMNSTKVQNPRRVNEPAIHLPSNSIAMESSEELAQPQRRLEKHTVLHQPIFHVAFSTPLSFRTTISTYLFIVYPISGVRM